MPPTTKSDFLSAWQGRMEEIMQRATNHKNVQLQADVEFTFEINCWTKTVKYDKLAA